MFVLQKSLRSSVCEKLKQSLHLHFPKWIKHFRLFHLLSQEEFSDNIMISTRSYLDIEHGVNLPALLFIAVLSVHCTPEEWLDLRETFIECYEEAMEDEL